MIKRTFSYGRVSTEEQAFHRDGSLKKDASPEAQRQRCLEQAKFLSTKTGHQYKIVDHIADNACSGGNTNRPGYQRLWDLIGANQVDVVIATELSRLSRSVIDFLQLVRHCEAHKTDIVIIGLDLNTSAPFGKFLVVILIALAQLERETTGERVRENALIRLLKDGKINGAAEILGLDRDPKKPGHFLKNHDELMKVEKILNLFVKLSSKRKVLEAARELGLTGKKGRELTVHMLDIMLENAKWRYRGLWYANKENKGVSDKSLPESKQYRVVSLPHGQLINSELLDAVDEKLTDTYFKKKKSGKDGYVYLLSHLLLHEDGSRFQGQPGKGRKYRYYYNQKHKVRIHCHEIENVVIGKMKDLISNDQLFETMLKDAIKKRMEELPNIERQLNQVSKTLSEIEVTNHELAQRLADPTQRCEVSFMTWLEEQVEALRTRKLRLEADRDRLTHYKAEIERQQGLDNLKKTAQNFLKQFDGLTGTEKRNLLERFVEKIVLRSEKQLEIRFFGEPALGQSVMRWNKSTERERIGVASQPHSSLILPPLQPLVKADFLVIPLYRDKGFLLQKYVTEGLSIAEVARLCFSTRCAVRSSLKRHGISIKSQDELGKNKSQLRYGQAYRQRQVVDHKRELEVVEKMRQLRSQGFSYWKIADVLNTMKVPTKTRRGRWHARSVQQVLVNAVRPTL